MLALGDFAEILVSWMIPYALQMLSRYLQIVELELGESYS